MTFPPEGCSYEVLYPHGSETLSKSFADEFDLGDWFRAKEATGALTRTSRGLRVFCVAGTDRTPIDIMHPRLVRGRIERRH